MTFDNRLIDQKLLTEIRKPLVLLWCSEYGPCTDMIILFVEFVLQFFFLQNFFGTVLCVDAWDWKVQYLSVTLRSARGFRAQDVKCIIMLT